MKIRYGFLPDQLTKRNPRAVRDEIQSAIQAAYPYCKVEVIWKRGQGIRPQAVAISDYEPYKTSIGELETIRRHVLNIAEGVLHS